MTLERRSLELQDRTRTYLVYRPNDDVERQRDLLLFFHGPCAPGTSYRSPWHTAPCAIDALLGAASTNSSPKLAPPALPTAAWASSPVGSNSSSAKPKP